MTLIAPGSTVAIIGAGTMGAGIAQVAAEAGHPVLLFDAQETEKEVRFLTYDPYVESHPVELVYNRRERRFFFEGNDYFVGGWVNAYEVYSGWDY